MSEQLSIKHFDPKIYGINWNDDSKERVKEKPFCKYPNCQERVSTDHDRPKPFCIDHVFENPYVKELLIKINNWVDDTDCKETELAFQRLKINEKINEWS